MWSNDIIIMPKIVNIKTISREDIFSKRTTFMIINNSDKPKMSDQDKKDLIQKSWRIERYFDRNIYYFNDDEIETARRIFTNIESKDPENIHTFLQIIK